MNKLSPEFVLKSKGEAITDLNFWTIDASSEESDHLLAAYHNQGGVDVWDLKSRRVKINIPSIETSTVISVCGLSDRKIVSLDKDGHLRAHAVDNCKAAEIANLVIPNVAFCKAAVLAQDQGSNDIVVGVPGQERSAFNIWNLNQCKIIRRLIPPKQFNLGMPMCAKLFMENGLHAVVGYEDGSLLLWDVAEGKVISVAEHMFSEPVMCFDYCIGDRCGIAGSATNSLVKWKVPDVHVPAERTGEDDSGAMSEVSCSHFETLKTLELINSGVACAKIRPDKKILSTGGWDYKTRLFSWKTMKPLAVLEYHKGTVQALAFAEGVSSKQQILACGSTDHKISIWKVYND